ncbi:MAG: hypothetical protein SFV19_04620 [Rhodospirillaceae bacterium]|nr:hypothetical protein [Rhodospirillaceae bacterium]
MTQLISSLEPRVTARALVRGGAGRAAKVALSLLLAGTLLTGCSTVDKAWTSTKNAVTGIFSSDDKPAPASADSASSPQTAQAPSEAAEGLVADRDKAQYTDQGGRREPVTVRPLAETGSSPGDISSPPVPQAARAEPVTRLETPPAAPTSPAAPVPPRTTALAERLGAAPPPPPPAEGAVGTPGAPPVALQTRAQAAPTAGAPTRALVPMAQDYGSDTVVIDGGGVRGGQAVLGTPQLAAVPRASFDPGNSLVSSEVGVIAFTPGSAALSGAAKAELANIATLRSQVDGAIRIVGKGDNASARANAVARELRRLGVPAQRVFAGGADGAEPGNEAEIFLDY